MIPSEVEHSAEYHIAEVSDVLPTPGFASIDSNVADTEMPLERTWFTFNWFSEFFKDLTEEASSANLHEHKIETLDSPSVARNIRIQVSEEDISCFHNRIAQLESAQQSLPTDFTLPSRTKINRYLTAFFGYFVPHAPIIHIQCFEFQTFSSIPYP